MSGQDEATVKAFVDEHEATYPTMWQAASSAYSTGGVPSAYLIGPDGTVLWQGHPAGLSNGDIEDHLKDVEKDNRLTTWAFTLEKTLPPVPEKLSSAKKLLQKMKFGAALKKVESGMARMEGEEKTQAEALCEFIANPGKADLEKAQGLVEKGRIYTAFLLYGKVEERYKGHDIAKQAKDAAKALEKDKANKTEIKAGEKLAEIKVELRGERNPEKHIEALEALTSKKYADTVAGKQAAELIEQAKSRLGK